MAQTAEYEYAGFNSPPKKLISAEDYLMYFAEPIQLFASGDTGKKYARAWKRDENNRRNQERNKTGRGLMLDNLFEEFINVEIRRRLVVTLDYELVEDEIDKPKLELV